MREKQQGDRRLLVIILTAAAMVLAGVGVYFAGSLLDEKPTEETRGSLEGRFDSEVQMVWNGIEYNYRDSELTTILLIGVDKDELAYETAGYRNGTQADSMILFVADRTNKTLTPIQIDRDTIAEVDIYGITGNHTGTRDYQICLAQAFGKTIDAATRNTVTAVSRFLHGIPIDYYAVIDMGFISSFNELLGGVTVTVQDDLSAEDPAMVPGAVIKLQGSQAETFVRARRNVADGSNVNRMKRQRAFMNGAFDTFTEHVKKDNSFINQLADGLSHHYYSNMSQANMVSLINRLWKYDRSDFVTFTGEQTVSANNFREFHVDPDSVSRVLAQICFK